jgi:hypothetical protein
MLRRVTLYFAPLLLVAACADQPTEVDTALAPSISESKTAQGGRANGALGTVYVSNQGLYYDTFVSADELPPHGRFQKLDAGVTEFGPGDPGYLGGRWWIDSNGNDIQDEGDTYLLCPLLPPGRTSP